MSNEELKEKIVKWLGWEFHSDRVHWRMSSSVLGWSLLKNLPDFPNDLNACFEYIVPKLAIELGYHFVISGMYYENAFNAAIEKNCNCCDKPEDVTRIYIDDKSPALAFCRAVEKLIDASS